ncbi:hypothetical protein PIB30_038982 [Stylosanthes scabra]|uniref:Uncharacterized protein n=1 Tax=Stylosanthes scabra TaxID=79078 RepID=A0ABU6XFQ0_9FABA|nr:hypothetical protein [Stylosanthes scabra]
MPIYGDYHGDFQKSNNSSWDQIQATLKILLPSYQPIPSDSLDELSFLSDQKQKRMLAEIKEVCNNMCSTLNEMIQEQEQADAVEQFHNNSKSTNDYKLDSRIQHSTTNSSYHKRDPDPDQNIQAQIQQNSIAEITDLDFQFQISTELAPTYQKPKSSRQITEITTSEQANSESEFQILHNSSANQKDKWNSANSEDQKQEDEDESKERSNYHGCDDRSVAVVVQRPPPEPPDLESLSVGDGEQAVAWSYKPEDLMDAATGIHSGAEDSAVAKGNVDNGKAESFSHFLGDDDTADLNCSGCVRDVDEGTRPATSVNIGESTASARSGTEHGAIGTTTDGGLRARRFLSLTPPPLLAAVLPWNRGGEEEVWSHDAWNWTVNTNEEAVDVEDVILVNGTTNDACDSGTHGGRCVPWLAAMVEVSLKREVVVGVAATIGEKGVGVIRFGLLLGLTHTQDLEAHIKEEQAALFNWSSHYNFSAYWRQVQFSAATFFCFRINDGLGYKQWDPGIFFIESNRLVIK